MAILYRSKFSALIATFLLSAASTINAAATVALRADSFGICNIYTIQAGDSCPAIAQAHGITAADIERLNSRTWDWLGCENLPQGSFICVSAGEPPMPVSLPNAVCGPQVPGATRPGTWSEIGSLNPCPANECCASWGQCGTSADFCAAHGLAVPAPSNPNGSQVRISTSTTTSIAKMTAPVMAATSSRTLSSDEVPLTYLHLSETTSSITTKSLATTKPISTTKSIPTTKSTSTIKSTATTADRAPWSFRFYANENCHGAFVEILGTHAGAQKKCMNPRHGMSVDITDNGVSCKFWRRQDDRYMPCEGIDVWKPKSWMIRDAMCTVYDKKDCDASDNMFQSYSSSSCQNRGKFDPDFDTMSCYYFGS